MRDAATPDGDIEIECPGPRTAEKLFEELLIGTNVTGTDRSMIMRAVEPHLPWMRMQQMLNDQLVDIREYVWTRKTLLPHAPAAEVADFAAQRHQSEAIKPQTPIA